MMAVQRLVEARRIVQRAREQLSDLDIQFTERELQALEGARLELQRLAYGLAAREEHARSQHQAGDRLPGL